MAFHGIGLAPARAGYSKGGAAVFRTRCRTHTSAEVAPSTGPVPLAPQSILVELSPAAAARVSSSFIRRHSPPFTSIRRSPPLPPAGLSDRAFDRQQRHVTNVPLFGSPTSHSSHGPLPCRGGRSARGPANILGVSRRLGVCLSAAPVPAETETGTETGTAGRSPSIHLSVGGSQRLSNGSG